MSFIRNLSHNVLTKRINVASGAFTAANGTSNLTSDVVNTIGYQTARFITTFGAAFATNGAVTLVIQALGSDNSTWSNVSGLVSVLANNDNGKQAILELSRPTQYQQYLRQVTYRVGNIAVDCCTLELGAPLTGPVTQDGTVISGGIAIVGN